MPSNTEPQALSLRTAFHRIVRGFGLLAGDRTPCQKPLSISYAHALMVFLQQSRQGQKSTQSTLVARLGINKSNVSRLCKQMVKRGHLRENRAAEDGRARHISLTPSGHRIAVEVDQASSQRFAQLLRAIPKQDQEAVHHGLRILAEAIDQMDAI